MSKKIAVIIAAGGKGERFGGKEKKTFAQLDGRPIFIRTLEMFVNRDDVCQTILVVPAEDMPTVKEKYGPNMGFMGVQVVEGGEERHDSVAAALEHVRDDAELVAVHDAVRPCMTEALLESVIAAAGKSGAAIPAAPLHGTIKRVADAGTIEETVSRAGLYEAQTPQIFKRNVLLEAYEKKPEDCSNITDDAQLVEMSGHPVTVVKSDHSNIKITTKGDMTLAAAVLKSRPRKSGPKLGAFEEAQW